MGFERKGAPFVLRITEEESFFFLIRFFAFFFFFVCFSSCSQTPRPFMKYDGRGGRLATHYGTHKALFVSIKHYCCTYKPKHLELGVFWFWQCLRVIDAEAAQSCCTLPCTKHVKHKTKTTTAAAATTTHRRRSPWPCHFRWCTGSPLPHPELGAPRSRPPPPSRCGGSPA